MKFSCCLLACASWLLLGCGSDSTNSGSTASAGEDSPDVSSVETSEASAKEAQSVSTLGDVKQVMQMFVEDDPTLDLSLSALENATNVESRLTSVLATACPTVAVQHERASTEVTAVLDNCSLESGINVSGKVTAAITRRELGPGGELSVAFSFAKLTLGEVVVDGEVMVTTTDLTYYPMTAELQISPLGKLTFAGTAALRVAKPPEATLNGTGEFTSEGSSDANEIATNDWTCTGGTPSLITVVNMHRIYGQCHANAGTLDVKKTYDCSKSVGKQTLKQSVQANVALQWSSMTPTDDVIEAQLTTTINNQKKTGELTAVTLPWSCD